MNNWCIQVWCLRIVHPYVHCCRRDWRHRWSERDLGWSLEVQLFTIGGLIQTFTVGIWTIILGRLISGFGVGLLSWVILTSCSLKLKHVSKNYCSYLSEWDIPSKPCTTPNYFLFCPYLYSLERCLGLRKVHRWCCQLILLSGNDFLLWSILGVLKLIVYCGSNLSVLCSWLGYSC